MTGIIETIIVFFCPETIHRNPIELTWENIENYDIRKDNHPGMYFQVRLRSSHLEQGLRANR